MIFNMVGNGSGQSLLISDTLDANGGTIRTITAKKVVNLQTKTITPTSSAQTVNPDTGYDGFSQVVVEAGGGGGLNTPTFTEIWSNDWNTLISITCDKTFLECHTYYVNGVCDALLISTTQDESETYKSFIKITGGGDPRYALRYTFLSTCRPVYDIVYNPDGTIEETTPSELLETLNVTQNGTYYPGAGYIGEVNVSVSGGTPTLQNKTVTPTTSLQTIQADSGYDGLGTVTVNAMPTMTLPTSAAASATSGYTSKATISRSTSDQYINIPPGYNSAGGYYKISAVANGSATAPSTISGTSATITTGTNTLTLTKTVSVTPTVTAGYVSSGTAGNSSVSLTASVTVNPTPTASGATVTIPAGYYSSQTTKSVTSGSASAPSTISGTSATVTTGTNTLTLTKTVSVTPSVSAGYVSSGTATNSSVSLTASVTTKAAATITPGTTNQTIASGTYLTGTQTIAGDADLVASNIVDGVQIFGVTGNVVLQNYYTGSSAPSSSLGSNGDLYLQS